MLDFAEVRERIERHSQDCHDHKVQVGTLAMAPDTGRVLVADVMEADVTPYAHQQMLGRLGVEKRAFDKMTVYPKGHDHAGETDRKFQARIVNTRFDHHARRRWLVRARGDTVRAFLSDRFRVYDHRPFMDALLDPRTNIQNVAQVHDFKLGLKAEDLYLKLVFPGLSRNYNGESYQVGICSFNGELGNRSTGLEGFIYRAKCTNDLIVMGEHSWRQVHMGGLTSRIVTAIFAQRTLGVLEDALDKVDKLEGLREVEIPDLGRELKRIQKKHGLSDDESAGMELMSRKEAEGAKMSAFAVVNGMTGLARLQESPDRRIDLEQGAGKLFEEYVQKLHRQRVSAPAE